MGNLVTRKQTVWPFSAFNNSIRKTVTGSREETEAGEYLREAPQARLDAKHRREEPQEFLEREI